MNTRQAIQPSNQPAVLSLAFSTSGKRFVAGLADGVRCFRSDNCMTTYHPPLPKDGGIAVAAVHDDRYLAFVGGGRLPADKPSTVIFWDAVLGRETARFNLQEPVLGVRMNGKWMAVVLKERTVVFEYQQLQTPKLPTPPPDAANPDDGDASETVKAPNKVKALYPTSRNPHALAHLRDNLLVLPAQSIGQIQLIPLQGGSKRVLRAHNSNIRCFAVSPDGTLLATASEQGTLIRVFQLSNLSQVAEFRRGSDHAIIFSLAFSLGNKWLACTSDKGTLHIFDLRPPDPAEAAEKAARDRRSSVQAHRKGASSYAAHRLSGTAGEKDSLSGFSGRSSPATNNSGGGTTAFQGSVQEYYGLRPVPASASPPGGGVGISALAALKASPFAPRILKDVRRIASAPFHMGDEPPHWQGGAGSSWTTAPGGTRQKVRNPVAPLPNDPAGKAVKGVLHLASREGGDRAGDEAGATIYVVGGGSDARWEMFELLPAEGGGWGLVNKGFRRYLTRQFVD